MRRAAIFFAFLLLLGPAVAAPETRTASVVSYPLGEGTKWATHYYVRDSGKEGPTVVITAGIHGNEPAPTCAADQVRHWPIRRGRLVVLPRANHSALVAFKRRTPKVKKGLGDLNRNFPRAGKDEEPRGERAVALWAWLRRMEPDWLLDLHEGFDFHRTNKKSVGSSVIAHPTEEAQRAARLMVRAVNLTIPNEKRHFTLLETAANGSIARAAAEHLEIPSMIVETTWKLPRSLRARQQRILVHRLLRHLRMVDQTQSVDMLFDREAIGDRKVIGLYDAGGTGGSGVRLMWARLRRRKELYVHRIGPDEVRDALDQFDAVIFGGGMGSRQAGAVGKSGRLALRRFVRSGGGYIGVCAGAYLATADYSWGLKVLDARTVSSKWRRGGATLEMELTDRGREIFGDLGERVEVQYHNGPILEPAGKGALPDYEPLAHFRTEIAENGTLKGIQVGSPAICGGHCGKGRVVVFSPHPERSRGLETMIERAVRWVSRSEGSSP